MNPNIFTSWWGMFTFSLNEVWVNFINFVPSFLLAVVVFIIGWIIASYVGKAVAQVISALKVDKAFESAGAGKAMEKAGMRVNVGGFIGAVVKWFIIIAFLMACLDFMQLSDVSTFLRSDVLPYLPRIIEAALILVAATLVADVMGKAVMVSANAGNIRSANLLGSLARYAIWVTAFIMALSELGIATYYMQTLYTGFVAMLVIAGGLAFGLGGKDAASRMLEKLHEKTRSM